MATHLSTVEARVLEAVDDAAAVQLLAETVRCPSVTVTVRARLPSIA